MDREKERAALASLSEGKCPALLGKYFESIEELLPQLRPLGYRFMSTARTNDSSNGSQHCLLQAHPSEPLNPERMVQAALFWQPLFRNQVYGCVGKARFSCSFLLAIGA